MTCTHINDILRSLFVNMHETAIILILATLISMHGERKLLQSDMEAKAARDKRFASLLMLMDINCLFCYFRALTNSIIARNVRQIFPSGMQGCVQEKVWMDNCVMSI